MIQCFWVYGYDKGRGNFQGRGMGKAFLKATEDDAKTLGAKGIAGWGVYLSRLESDDKKFIETRRMVLLR